MAKKLAPHHKVRTSQQDRTLDSMFPVVNPSQKAFDGQKPAPVKVPEIKSSDCNLDSVLQLRDQLDRVKHAGENQGMFS